jgi:hypothetical protein
MKSKRLQRFSTAAGALDLAKFSGASASSDAGAAVAERPIRFIPLRFVDAEVAGRPLNGGDLPDGGFPDDCSVVADPQTDTAVAGKTADGQRPIVFGDTGRSNWWERSSRADTIQPESRLHHEAIKDLSCAEGRSGVEWSRHETNSQDGEAIGPGKLGAAFSESRWNSKFSGVTARPGPEGESDTDVPGFSLVKSNGSVAGRCKKPEGIEEVFIMNSVPDGPGAWTGFEADDPELMRNRGPTRPSVVIRGSSAAPAPVPGFCSTPSPAMPPHSSLVKFRRTG